MSMFRVYFYNLNTRKEVTEFEGNGKQWLSTSGNIMKDGEFVRDTCTFVDVANYADLSTVKGERRITAKDFDFPVAVKIWYSPNNIEWRKLLPAE